MKLRLGQRAHAPLNCAQSKALGAQLSCDARTQYTPPERPLAAHPAWLFTNVARMEP